MPRGWTTERSVPGCGGDVAPRPSRSSQSGFVVPARRRAPARKACDIIARDPRSRRHVVVWATDEDFLVRPAALLAEHDARAPALATSSYGLVWQGRCNRMSRLSLLEGAKSSWRPTEGARSVGGGAVGGAGSPRGRPPRPTLKPVAHGVCSQPSRGTGASAGPVPELWLRSNPALGVLPQLSRAFAAG
jgi:hypothetical protein